MENFLIPYFPYCQQTEGAALFSSSTFPPNRNTDVEFKQEFKLKLQNDLLYENQKCRQPVSNFRVGWKPKEDQGHLMGTSIILVRIV